MHLVETETELVRTAEALSAARTLYLDTEFDSTRDGKTLCLLQISAGAEVYLVDALRLGSLGALAPVLCDPERTWVVHAGSQDVDLIAIALDVTEPPRLFDTQVAWSLTCVEHSVSLAYLKFRLLGLRTGKSHQADDWKRRPLPRAQLAYAAQDIEDLPRLYLALAERLAARGREHLVFEASRDVTWPKSDLPEPLSIDSFRNAWQLDVKSQAALRHLVAFHNALSSETRAHAPEPKALLAIASRLPATADELARIKGVPRRFAAEHGRALVAGLVAAAAAADPRDFVWIDPPPYATPEELRLDGWLARCRAELSAALEVAPELAFPQRLMRKLKERVQSTGDRRAGALALEGFRQALLRDAYLDFCESGDPADGTKKIATPGV